MGGDVQDSHAEVHTMTLKFLYVCAGLFLPAIAYHLEASTATAQAPGNPVVGIAISDYACPFVVTANGDTYISTNGHSCVKLNNVIGAPTPAQQESWGQVKGPFGVARSTTSICF